MMFDFLLRGKEMIYRMVKYIKYYSELLIVRCLDVDFESLYSKKDHWKVYRNSPFIYQRN